jgi:hypothetical protein
LEREVVPAASCGLPVLREFVVGLWLASLSAYPERFRTVAEKAGTYNSVRCVESLLLASA